MIARSLTTVSSNHYILALDFHITEFLNIPVDKNTHPLAHTLDREIVDELSAETCSN